MVHNFDTIADLLEFPKNRNDIFYFIQLIVRNKDTGETNKSHRVIKEYSIFSVDALYEKEDEVIELCDKFKARAYIRLSARDTKTIAISMIQLLAKAIEDNSFNHIRKIYSTAVGRNKGHHKKRIIDLDGEEAYNYQDILDHIKGLMPAGDKLIKKVPTKNGLHLIVHPFDLSKFEYKYDVHKNNPTLLYCP